MREFVAQIRVMDRGRGGSSKADGSNKRYRD
jgi:hypothetical protein